ncbi:hypothetical protein ABPG75_005038 [Micractinium tetrahymenae]
MCHTAVRQAHPTGSGVPSMQASWTTHWRILELRHRAALRCSMAPRCRLVALGLLALAAAALAVPAAAQGDSPSPDAWAGDSPSPDSWAGGSPSPGWDDMTWMGDGSPSPSPADDSMLSPSPGRSDDTTWMSPESPSPDPYSSPHPYASPSPSPSPSPGAEDPWASPESPNPFGDWAASPSPAPSPEASAPPPEPVASLPPPPPPSPPPPPVGWPDRITLFLDGAPYPLSSDQTAAVADSLSALTPGYRWQFMLQQPAYEGQQPEVPAMNAAPSPAPAPASSAAAAAAAAPALAAALLAPAPGPGPASPDAADLAQRVSVDPLPQNNLGGRRRLRQATPPAAATSGGSALELPFATKEQCYSVRHVLAPDEAACVTYCDGQVAAGAVDAAELKPRFYGCQTMGACPTGTSCCRCVSSKKPSPPPAGAAASPAAPAPSADSTTPSASPPPTTPSPDASPTPATPGAVVPSSPAASVPAPALAAQPIGVFYFASTTVFDKRAELALNRTLSKAASSGALLSGLQGVAGQSLGAVDILYLGSGKWEFAPVPQRYHRGLDSGSDTASNATATASAGTTNKGTIIGIALGAGCGVAVLLAIVTVVVLRRRRAKKLDGRAVVRRWESERRQADEFRLSQAEQRRAASQRATARALSKSQRGSGAGAGGATNPLTLNATSYQPRLPNLERLRDALGLRRDHLAAAAAKVDAAEAAQATATAAAAPASAAQAAASPRRSSSSGGTELKRSFTTFGSAREGKRPGPSDTAGSEAPLTTVVVRPQGGPPATAAAAPAPAAAPAGPSWAMRDPAATKSSGGGFGNFFSRKS